MAQFMRAEDEHHPQGIWPAAPDLGQLALRMIQQRLAQGNRRPCVQQAEHRQNEQDSVRPPGAGARVEAARHDLNHMRAIGLPEERELIEGSQPPIDLVIGFLGVKAEPAAEDGRQVLLQREFFRLDDQDGFHRGANGRHLRRHPTGFAAPDRRLLIGGHLFKHQTVASNSQAGPCRAC